jgi:hypothetical protein
MKITVLVLMLAAICIAPVYADRIIFAPTGMTLSPGEVKVEGAISPSSNNNRVYWAGVGMQRFEINAIHFTQNGSVMGISNADVINVELSLLPETTLTPGVGIGAWDIAGKTPSGTGYFFAISKQLPLTKSIPTPIRDIRVHTGFGINGIHGGFAGAEASLPFRLKIAGEYFQKDFNFSLAWTAIPAVQFKAYLLDKKPYYGVEFKTPL